MQPWQLHYSEKKRNKRKRCFSFCEDVYAYVFTNKTITTATTTTGKKRCKELNIKIRKEMKKEKKN